MRVIGKKNERGRNASGLDGRYTFLAPEVNGFSWALAKERIKNTISLNLVQSGSGQKGRKEHSRYGISIWGSVGLTDPTNKRLLQWFPQLRMQTTWAQLLTSTCVHTQCMHGREVFFISNCNDDRVDHGDNKASQPAGRQAPRCVLSMLYILHTFQVRAKICLYTDWLTGLAFRASSTAESLNIHPRCV